MSDAEKARTSAEILRELRAACLEIRKLIKSNPPKELIGYFWSQVLLSLISKFEHDKDNQNLPSVSHQESSILFAMEYVHATISVDGLSEVSKVLDVDDAEKILRLSGEAISLCFQYEMAETRSEDEISHIEDQRLAFQILSCWVMIRGRRFQVLEEEFFSYVLAPHNDAIRNAYGIDSGDLARRVQKIADAPRVGFDRARTRMNELMKELGVGENIGPDKVGDAMAAALEAAKASPAIFDEVTSIIDDMFYGGLFNLSKHGDLPQKLLSDLSFSPGTNNEFDDGSEISGTPFKTLPARVRPLVDLDGEFYCTEPNFVRDSTYRCLQRALVDSNPDYKEEWNRQQKRMSEDAFADLMADHLQGARVFKDIYYPIGNKRWAETDCVILLGDVLINVEAKAGSEALAAPAESLNSHLRTIEKLVVDAYTQTKRFVDYLYSKQEAPLYEKLPNGKYCEVARIKTDNLRKIFPIGLTVEAFTPFSSLIKENPDVVAIQGRHEFISLSIDDLMVIRRLLRGTGEFLHYLDVRQALASMKNVMLFDEMDHLGSYISQNRIDQQLKEMIEEQQVDQVWVDGMDQDVIGPYFSDPNWPNVEIPAQKYPEKTLELLSALERGNSDTWLAADTFVRDLNGAGRNQFADYFAAAFPNLRFKPVTFFALAGEDVAMFGLMRFDTSELREMITRKAEALALAVGIQKVRLFELLVRPSHEIVLARMRWAATPSFLRVDYPALLADAEQLKRRLKVKKVN